MCGRVRLGSITDIKCVQKSNYFCATLFEHKIIVQTVYFICKIYVYFHDFQISLMSMWCKYTYFEFYTQGLGKYFFCPKKNGNQNMQSVAISNMMMFSHTKSMNNSKFKELPVWRVCSCGLICYKVEQAIFVCLFFTRYSRRLTLHLYYIILAAL